MTAPMQTAKPKDKKSKAPEIARIKVLEDMLETNRIEAEGWRQVASDRLQKLRAAEQHIDQLNREIEGLKSGPDLAQTVDDQAVQIESLRRALDEKDAFIDNLVGIKSRQKKTS